MELAIPHNLVSSGTSSISSKSAQETAAI